MTMDQTNQDNEEVTTVSTEDHNDASNTEPQDAGVAEQATNETSTEDASTIEADPVEAEAPQATEETRQTTEESTTDNATTTDESETELTDEPANQATDQLIPDDISDTDLLSLLAPGEARWYVIHTYSGHEKKVASALKQRIASMRLTDKIFDILIPTQEKIEVRKGKKEKHSEKIFPGYILVKMIVDDYSWLAVRTTPGVTGFVGMGNKPTPIPEEEVKAIQKFMSMEAPKYKAVFSVGEAVRIADGPFAEFLGTVDSIDEAKGKIKVLVSIFGRETPVELDFLQVSKL